MCISYGIDPREFVEIYVAYILNHMNGAEPTESIMDEFERKELANHKKASRNISKLQRSINEYDDNVSDDDDNDVMGAYIGCTTPKVRDRDSVEVIHTFA